MFNILIVEDDKNLRKLVVTYLKKNNYNTYESIDGKEALNILDKNYIDLIISDIMMPKMSGFDLIKELRENNFKVPILLITAKGEIEDKKNGFLLGADDYMVKPINLEELLLRVQVLLRRSKSINEKKIKIDNFILDYNQMSVKRNNKTYNLVNKEFLLLYKLLSFPNIIFTRHELMEEIWGFESESDYRTIDVHIKRIREKLYVVKEFSIITIRGVGYKVIINNKE